MADTAVHAALDELGQRPGRGQLEALAAGRILTAQRTIDLWIERGARAMDSPDEALPDVAVQARVAIFDACRVLLDEAARACGSRPFARAGALDRARRDLEVFLLQHRLDPLLARLGEAALEEALTWRGCRSPSSRRATARIPIPGNTRPAITSARSTRRRSRRAGPARSPMRSSSADRSACSASCWRHAASGSPRSTPPRPPWRPRERGLPALRRCDVILGAIPDALPDGRLRPRRRVGDPLLPDRLRARPNPRATGGVHRARGAPGRRPLATGRTRAAARRRAGPRGSCASSRGSSRSAPAPPATTCSTCWCGGERRVRAAGARRRPGRPVGGARLPERRRARRRRDRHRRAPNALQPPAADQGAAPRRVERGRASDRGRSLVAGASGRPGQRSRGRPRPRASHGVSVRRSRAPLPKLRARDRGRANSAAGAGCRPPSGEGDPHARPRARADRSPSRRRRRGRDRLGLHRLRDRGLAQAPGPPGRAGLGRGAAQRGSPRSRGGRTHPRLAGARKASTSTSGPRSKRSRRATARSRSERAPCARRGRSW